MSRMFTVRANDKKHAAQLLRENGKIIGEVKVIVKASHSKIRKAFGVELGKYSALIEEY